MRELGEKVPERTHSRGTPVPDRVSIYQQTKLIRICAETQTGGKDLTARLTSGFCPHIIKKTPKYSSFLKRIRLRVTDALERKPNFYEEYKLVMFISFSGI